MPFSLQWKIPDYHYAACHLLNLLHITYCQHLRSYAGFETTFETAMNIYV